MKISPAQTVPAQTSVSQTPSQTPTQSPAPGVDVPKGQLDRVRANLPNGWTSPGGHRGFKEAVIHAHSGGLHLDPVNRADMPRGRQ